MKNKIKKILTLSLVATISLGSFVGCSKKDKPTLGMVVSTLNNPFFLSMKDGAEKKAKEMGYNLVVLDSQNDPAKERSNVEDLVQLGIKALILNPTDSDAAENTANVLKKKEIPIITLDRGVNNVDIDLHIASDNIVGGEMAGKYVLDNVKKSEIKVVELQGVPGASATRDRGKGFHNILDKDPKVKFVSVQAADFDRQKGLTVMENIIQANPEIDVVFAHNDEMALGAIKALKAANKTNTMVIGFDGNDDAKEAVKNGDMTITIAQQPDLMGSLAVEYGDKFAKAEKVDKFIPADLKIFKK
ncbi:ribose-binding protein [Clostridium cavendishii DSM 21758]|uniref:Ribose-binding protein n=1 Tax=Clostridium cavendishii DSM 21758 TaxID=1121302 RepID=A0A1M6RVV0_9CLOT|nr:ribose ABC transporter substrate-binding protein RbsB [Clostridium cavendishii]SHK36439.1 ribose-binding protein [Clostridium cavendishii DSM 21758]